MSAIQVITPSHKGSAGTDALNPALQKALNPPDKSKREKVFGGITFREGDKVMQIKNDYEIEWERFGETGSGIFNGDIGIIKQIDFKNEAVSINFDDRLCSYDFSQLDELEHAYAITIHKSQGSEYPIVVIPVYWCAPRLLTRNLLYTAITRAQRLVVLVGDSSVVQVMVENNRLIKRYSVFTINKWIFLWSAVLIMPFSAGHIVSTPWSAVPAKAWLSAGYVVFIGTFVAYLLTMVAQRVLRPTVVSTYNYVQPMVAVSVSLLTGMAVLKPMQCLAMVLVFCGVWLVIKSKSRHDIIKAGERVEKSLHK